MADIYDEQKLDELEESEHALTETALLAMFATLYSTQADLEKELRLFYQKYGKDGVVTYQEARKWVSEKDHQRRLTALLLLIGASFSGLFSKLQPVFGGMVDDVVAKEFDFFGVAIDQPKLNWGTDDLTWLDRLADDVNVWETKVANDIKQSLFKRENIEDVVKTMNARFVTMRNVLQRLGVTETTAVGSLARRGAFKELGIGKYQYFAREDERTCEQCGALHGLIFPISAYEIGVTASPIHANCRCWEVPLNE